jgi:hypothetical protein
MQQYKKKLNNNIGPDYNSIWPEYRSWAGVKRSRPAYGHLGQRSTAVPRLGRVILLLRLGRLAPGRPASSLAPAGPPGCYPAGPPRSAPGWAAPPRPRVGLGVPARSVSRAGLTAPASLRPGWAGRPADPAGPAPSSSWAPSCSSLPGVLSSAPRLGRIRRIRPGRDFPSRPSLSIPDGPDYSIPAGPGRYSPGPGRIIFILGRITPLPGRN